MAVFKCKMCGGTLNIENGATVAECEFCGRKQTIPKLDDEKRANLYDRANHFRRTNDYDKAMGIYEIILNEKLLDANFRRKTSKMVCSTNKFASAKGHRTSQLFSHNPNWTLNNLD